MNAAQILATLLLSAVALSGCGSRGVDPSAPVRVDAADTDAGFVRALILDDVSTRETPKPSARFVLSLNRDASTKYKRLRASEIIDSQSGCKFTVFYSPRMAANSTALSGAIPGAPGADQGVLDGNDDGLSMNAAGPQCARLAMRQDLALARDLAAAGARDQAVNQAFAQALASIQSAIEAGSKPDAASRFALTDAQADIKNASADYALIERSTGCLWRARRTAAGLVSLLSIEPDACPKAIAMAFAAQRKASSAPGAPSWAR